MLRALPCCSCFVLLIALACVAGCGSTKSTGSGAAAGGGPAGDGGGPDAGLVPDAGGATDAGATADTIGVPDSSSGEDSDGAQGGIDADGADSDAEDVAAVADSVDAGPPACTSVCDDGDACTIGDSCVSGVCLPGAATACNDGNACTTDTCDKASGCVHTAIAAGGACGGNMACSVNLATDPKLVGHWTFDGCDGKDASAAKNDGVVQGAPACIAGASGKALSLAGAAWVEVPNSPSLSVQGTALSLGGWVQLDGPGGYTILLNKENAYSLGFSAGGFISAIEINMPSFWKWLGTAPVGTKAWHHVTAVYDGAKVVHYVDGVPTSSYPLAGPLKATACGLGIGARGIGCGKPAQFLAGAVDDVFVFARALTAAEVFSLANKAWDGGCVSLPAPCTNDGQCNDAEPCTVDQCTAGACSHGPVSDGGTCDDGDDCTAVDACKAGSCVGTQAKLCPATSEACLVNTCAKNSAACWMWSVADGTACMGGTCTAGKCVE